MTFDDGWYDNAAHALPVLQQFHVPAVVFVASGFIGTARTFWQETLTRQLVLLIQGPELARQRLAEVGLANAYGVDAAFARIAARRFVTQLKLSSKERIDRVLEQVADSIRQIGSTLPDNGDDVFLDWDSINAMRATGLITIGSHAHSHVPLTRLGRAGTETELLAASREIQRRGLPAPTMLAYPNGDYDAEVVQALHVAGIMAAFTTEPGYVARGIDRSRLPRVNVHEMAAATTPEFLCRILGIF